MTKKLISVPVGATPNIARGVLRYESYGANIYLDTTLDNLIDTLTTFRKRYAATYTDLRIESKRDCGCYSYDCSCAPTYYVVGVRLENDVEYEYRLQHEARLMAQREERERQEYEILKAKFGG